MKRSGYAREVMPSVMEPEEKAGLTVPIASSRGMQEGIIPPAERQYKAKYGSVDLMTALANMTKRMNGELPEIKGGITDPEAYMAKNAKKTAVNTGVLTGPIPRKKAPAPKSKAVGRETFDPVGDMPEPEPGSAELEAEERRLAAQHAAQEGPRYVSTELPTPAPQTYATPTPEQEYLSKRSRVTLEMQDGSMSMVCIDVMESQFSLTILLPLDDNGATFIPKPGSEITVNCGTNKRWACYFPGAHFEIPELKLLGLVFIKAESK